MEAFEAAHADPSLFIPNVPLLPFVLPPPAFDAAPRPEDLPPTSPTCDALLSLHVSPFELPSTPNALPSLHASPLTAPGSPALPPCAAPLRVSAGAISKPRRSPRRFQCTVRGCERSFTRKYDMEKHELAVHLETRPFSCDVCFRGFCQKHHMERHKKHVHLKERLHKCEYCRVDFARKEHLHNHCRSKHAGQERMSCPVCGAKTESGTLVRHLLGRHEIEQGKAIEMGIWKPAENKSRGRRAKVQF